MNSYQSAFLLAIVAFVALVLGLMAGLSLVTPDLWGLVAERPVIAVLLVALFVSGFMLCGIMLLYQRKRFMERLADLGCCVSHICDTNDATVRLDVGVAGDELDLLTVNINKMLTSLEASRQKKHENEQRYRILFERAPDSIFVVTVDNGRAGGIVAANQAAVDQHGYSNDELCSMSLSDLDTEESQKVSAGLMPRIMRGEWVTAELMHRRKDGGLLPLEAHAGLVSIRERSYLLCFARDITARKSAEEADRKYMDQFRQINAELARKANELETANRELESFNYSVSHDMRGPLTRISGYCQLMLDEPENLDPAYRDYLSRIYESSCWLDEMIDAMLKLSQLVRAEFTPREVDLSRLCENALLELSQAEPGRKVEADIMPGVTAEGDANLLRIAMANLVGNAWKYSAGREPTRIAFGVDIGQQPPVYYIRDNGVGFDMKDAGRLFRVFTRLHTHTSFVGSGIGLATVQRIIIRHGGKIWAESELGKGAAFYFTLVGDKTAA